MQIILSTDDQQMFKELQVENAKPPEKRKGKVTSRLMEWVLTGKITK